MSLYCRYPQHIFIITAFILAIIIILTRHTEQLDASIGHTEPPADLARDPKLIYTEKGYMSYSEIENNILRPLGYEIMEEAVVPVLKYINPPTCASVFETWLQGSSSQDESAAPPRDIPAKLLPQYSLYGHVLMDLTKGYADDRSGTHLAKWEKSEVDRYVAKDPYTFKNYDGEGDAVYRAMKTYGIKGQSGLVIGSLSPWVEAYTIKLGAAKVKTIEYMKIETPKEYPWMSYSHPLEIAKSYREHVGAYDFIVSFSSIEHSGLGRFGDALDPMGDIKETQKMFCMLKEGGLLFLGIPIGKDTVHWNKHRNYGRIRLAMMAVGFEILDSFHFKERVQLSPEYFINSDEAQPLIVMRKQYTQSISQI